MDVIVVKLKAPGDNLQSLRPLCWVLRVSMLPKYGLNMLLKSICSICSMNVPGTRDRSKVLPPQRVGRHFSISRQQRVTDDDTGDEVDFVASTNFFVVFLFVKLDCRGGIEWNRRLSGG